ncbi:hypothetical protein ASPWEDRAFT_85592, partial [Aspergillus wentii DTO 134E9]
SLGCLAQFPYEIREQIWLQFIPDGQDTVLLRTPKTDLRILRASKSIHDEISLLLYRRSCLEFDVSAIYYQRKERWTTVYLRRGRQERAQLEEPQATWILRNKEDARTRGFDNLPFHRIDRVVANLFAPDPKDAGKLFCLWQRVRALVELLKGAEKIRNLTIRLCKRDGQDWFDRDRGMNHSMRLLRGETHCDHDVAVLPFCTLQNVENITVEAHSAELEQRMNWRVINVGKIQESEARLAVSRRVGFEYMWLHADLWKYAPGRTARLMRWDFLRQWFLQKCNGESEFEERTRGVLDEFPELHHRRPRDMMVISSMIYDMVCLYY